MGAYEVDKNEKQESQTGHGPVAHSGGAEMEKLFGGNIESQALGSRINKCQKMSKSQ